MPLLLTSPAFAPGGAIPAEYTCDGTDISPPLGWSGAPPATRSLVLVVVDPDAPGGAFGHWAAYDIPPGTPGLPAGYRRGMATPIFHEARNDFGKPGYGGPCPPPGNTHHYRFELLALRRASLEVAPSASVAAVLKAAAPYAIARAELVGTYRR